jgi:CYTH domain-containing protein
MPEIERKWLLDELPPGFPEFPAAHVRQGYLAVTDDVEVRVREIDGRHLLTVKGSGSMTREEVELAIGLDDFERLWTLTRGRRIEKTRTELPVDGRVAEVDVYAGALAPLCVVEIEFASEQEAKSFSTPPWFGREVTHDQRYKNRRLALAGLPPD